MKVKLLPLLILLGFTLSCEKDSLPPTIPTTLNIGESVNLVYDEGWITTNDSFVISVSGNTITANHVGKATITWSLNKNVGSSVQVVLNPKNMNINEGTSTSVAVTVPSSVKSIPEPYVKFGKAMQEVKADLGEPDSSTSNALLYDKGKNVQRMFSFEDGKLKHVYYFIKKSSSALLEVPTFLNERFKYVSEGDGWLHKKGQTIDYGVFYEDPALGSKDYKSYIGLAFIGN